MAGHKLFSVLSLKVVVTLWTEEQKAAIRSISQYIQMKSPSPISIWVRADSNGYIFIEIFVQNKPV